MSEPLLYEQDGHVVTLTLNRPDTRNALSGEEMFEAIIDACGRVDRDIDVRAVILTGAGSAFCAGGDVKKMREGGGMFAGGPLEIRNGYLSGIQRIPLAIHDLRVPTIAAVNGPAIGAGCDLACMCDIRLAGAGARFAESFVRLGIIPGDGGAWFLPRAIGMSRAAEMTFTGEAIDAQTAADWGLVSRVVPDEQLMSEARALAGRIAANPPQAVRMAKRLLREGQTLDLAALLEMAAAFQALCHKSEDHREAIAAFFEKRPGKFTGR